MSSILIPTPGSAAKVTKIGGLLDDVGGGARAVDGTALSKLWERIKKTNWSDDTGSANFFVGSSRLTNPQATQMAARLGFRPTNYTSMGQTVFTNGKLFIVQDITSHTGGLWKMANSFKTLAGKARLGTYDFDLNWIAP